MAVTSPAQQLATARIIKTDGGKTLVHQTAMQVADQAQATADQAKAAAATVAAIAELNTATLASMVNKVVPPDTGPGDFMSAVKHIQRRDKSNGMVAMERARTEYPALFDKMQANHEPTRHQTIAKAAAVLSFEKRIEEVARRDGVSKYAAMPIARREFNDEFQAYQEAD